MLVTTTEGLNGHTYKALGEVFGITTQSRNAISDWGASLKDVFGGEVKGYTKMLHRARQESVHRMKVNAQDLGGDAVVMMRFDSGSIGSDMQSVVAYGTAVKIID